MAAKPPPSAPAEREAAAKLLGVPVGAGEAELRSAYREAARRAHPDKTGDQASASEFVQLREALDLLLADDAVPPPPPPPAGGRPRSEQLDKHFFGTAFGSDEFDPRGWPGEADAGAVAAGQPVQCVWRCTQCPTASSVCCRLKPKKHSCICGHKLEGHSQRRKFACEAKGCKCPRMAFHCQQLGWEVRCRCKHHVKDHQSAGAPPWRCSKTIPGKDKKPCPCAGFHASWVCTCGHPWDAHETTWSLNVSKAAFAREWVAQGLRPECVQEAEEKREKWDAEVAAVAAEQGVEAAKKALDAKVRRVGVSMCAEARMQEAVERTLDGSRLPSKAASPALKAAAPVARTVTQGASHMGVARPLRDAQASSRTKGAPA